MPLCRRRAASSRHNALYFPKKSICARCNRPQNLSSHSTIGPPYDGGDDAQGGKEGFSELVVACGDAAEVIQTAECALHDISRGTFGPLLVGGLQPHPERFRLRRLAEAPETFRQGLQTPAGEWTMTGQARTGERAQLRACARPASRSRSSSPLWPENRSPA